jgi:hypothetical protein
LIRHYERVPRSDNTKSFRRLGLALKGRASTATEQQVGASFDARVDDSLDLVDHNEAVIGFENLASNVHEYGVAISADELRMFEKLAKAWDIRDDRWSYVREMVR